VAALRVVGPTKVALTAVRVFYVLLASQSPMLPSEELGSEANSEFARHVRETPSWPLVRNNGCTKDNLTLFAGLTPLARGRASRGASGSCGAWPRSSASWRCSSC
jgi:hypothetical protein